MVVLTRRGVLLGATALTASGFIPLKAMAADPRSYHALLVAVTDYPNLPKNTNLIGPNHDAMLVKEYLLANAPVKFEPQNVTLLADNIEGASSPTHAAIKDALAAIAAKVKRDDFVYLHLSGHGTQQPQTKDGDETDGLDEIFLPSDTDKWVDREKGVPNALVDDEVRDALDAIRSAGAFIWIIFDCCHSGTATRAAPVGDDVEKERKVDFMEDLVAEEHREAAKAAYSAGESASRGMEETGERKPGLQVVSPTGAESIAKGGLVAFYAAQSTETTPEMPLPKGDKEAPKYGLFTYTIFSKLAENPRITYRQLGHAVLQQYAADGRSRPTPLFEGELDATVFDIEAGPTILQWPLTVKDGAATVSAGLLHRLSPGSKLAILPSPQSDMEAALGYVEVISAKNLESKVKPVEFSEKPALAVDQIPANAYARVAELKPYFGLVVARPAASTDFDAEVKLVNDTLDALAAKPEKKFEITLAEPGASADLRFAVLAENAIKGATADASRTAALWFLPPSGDVTLQDGKKPPLVAVDTGNPQKLAEALEANLETIYRATSLSRLAVAAGDKIDKVDVTFMLKRQDKDEKEPLEASSVPFVHPGDEIHVVAKNGSNKPVDLNILYVGSDYSITHIDAQRLTAGAEVDEGLLAFTDTSFGMERMIAVMTEAPPLSEIEDLKFLEHGGVPPETRGIGDGLGLGDMLRDIGEVPATRGALKLSGKGESKGAVMIFQVETMPAKG